ncbi:MAG: hypothetical protein GY792_09510 [Gammaproteobacteria bacterium]|nr:hypothetical protein [Gammaproteobacteria bacterium]
MDKLIFTSSPTITIAANTFVNVPTILQYEDTPLIQVVKAQPTGFTTQIPIYHPDGTYLAKVVGSRLFTTSDGEKAGLSLIYPDRRTVCKLGNQVLFEIIRKEAAALKTRAELYTPEGYFVKCTDTPQPKLFNASGDSLQVRGITMVGNLFQGCRIGVWIRRDGSVAIGSS